MNEPDAYALEEALRLKEKHGGEVVVCSRRPGARVRRCSARRWRAAPTAPSTSRATALGARRRVRRRRRRSPRAMKDEQFDLVLTGLQSDDQGFAPDRRHPRRDARHAARDDHHGSAGRDGAALRVKRELEGGWFQWVAMPLPAVLTIQSGINQLRYATLKGHHGGQEERDPQSPPAPAAMAAAQAKIVSLYVPEKSKKTQMIAGAPAEAAKELVRAPARGSAGHLVILGRSPNSATGSSIARRWEAIAAAQQLADDQVTDRRARRQVGVGAAPASCARRRCRKSSWSTRAAARAVHARRLHGGARRRRSSQRRTRRCVIAAAHLPDTATSRRSWRRGSTAALDHRRHRRSRRSTARRSCGRCSRAS